MDLIWRAVMWFCIGFVVNIFLLSVIVNEVTISLIIASFSAVLGANYRQP